MKTSYLQSGPAGRRSAFTLIEVLVSVSLVAYLMVILFSATDAASRAWRDGNSRTDAFQSGRTMLEIMAREITPAVVDTRMQFVVAPGSILDKAGAPHVATEAPALLWMAPIGQEGGLRCVGYYLLRDPERKFYRLQRLLIAPTDAQGRVSKYFPRIASAQDPNSPARLIDPRDPLSRPSAIDATWFTRTWDETAFDAESENNEQAVVSSAADGVIALWVQCIDLLGQPIPLVSKAANHPRSVLAYNSAAYFQVATSAPFEDGRSLLYLAETPQTLKANRLPQAVEITVMTLDHNSILQTAEVPAQVNELDKNGALDVQASRLAYEEILKSHHIYSARVFSTRARLLNGN